MKSKDVSVGGGSTLSKVTCRSDESMITTIISKNHSRTLGHHSRGQSLVEFALILPLFVLLLVGVFDIGRAFFAYIAISNAAREGARVYTFWPDKITVADINTAVYTEIGTSTVVDPTKIVLPIRIKCGDPFTDVSSVAGIITCPSEEPISVTITYTQDLILSFFLPKNLTLVRTAEMMVP